MTFDEILAQVIALLQREGRLSYQGLKLRFNLDDEYLEGLKDEIIEAKQLAADERGKVLVWTGSLTPSSLPKTPDPGPRTPDPIQSPAPSPVSYTPKHLAERIRAEQEAMEARASEGERKTITVLFADIKGSMNLIEGLDPEEARAIIDPTLKLMMDAVHHYDGYVAQSTGDGIFAFFGAPIAHEDHAHRAIYAALRMQEEAKRRAEQLQREKGVNLQVRVGLNSGEMVLRAIHKDNLHAEYLPIGHSTSLAARMESLATPGSIVVSEYSYKLTEGYFEFKALGETRVKGVSEPLRVYEVLGVGLLRTRLQVAARRGLARFVGRRHELGQLTHAWERAQAGHGQIVGVMGEPGVGKSRLFHEFKLSLPKGYLLLETFSTSHGKAYAYLPLIELLKNYFQLTPQDDEQKRREKITEAVLTLDRNLEDILPYLFALFGIAEPTSPLQQMDANLRRRRTLEALKRLFLRESFNRPLILIFEDLQWLDTETQAFLMALSESLATARMLLLVNYRPEYQHSWGNKMYYTQLRLDPLGQADTQALLAALLEGKGEAQHAASLQRLILEKTEGNPFFIEEIVQTLMEEGVLANGSPRGVGLKSSSANGLHLPPTVQAVLAARIDRLPGAEKELLQTLAVIGKEFSFSLLQQAVNRPEDTLYSLLSYLQEAEFIYERPSFPEVEYIFKNTLTQDVAYNSLLIERRKVLHEQVAQAIEALFHSRLEDYASDLAHHYTRSGNAEKAVEYLQLAGRQALQRSANTEAIHHLTSALELLKTLPDFAERVPQELSLQVALGVSLQSTLGSTASEVEKVYARARELCQQLGDAPQLIPVLGGLWTFYLLRGELETTHELAGQILALARDMEAPALLLQAHRMMGTTLFWRGELAAAQEHLEKAMALYDPQLHRSHAFLYYGLDPEVTCLTLNAWVLWLRGHPDRSYDAGHKVLILAQDLAHPPSLAYALNYLAIVHCFRGEGEMVRQQAEMLITFANDQGLPYWAMQGPIQQGWALVEQGQYEVGVAQMRHGLAARHAVGAKLGATLHLAWLAEAQAKAAQGDEGLAVLAEAMTTVSETGERINEAELYRLKGELTLQKSGVRSPESGVPNTQHPAPSTQGEAEACFHQAIEIARCQGAKSLELRAVMSLAHLWQKQGKGTEARQMLAEIYDWFTEGLATTDLKEAKALLEELS
jgi:class 3 adenylate cyclase/predicted ATPase